MNGHITYRVPGSVWYTTVSKGHESPQATVHRCKTTDTLLAQMARESYYNIIIINELYTILSCYLTCSDNNHDFHIYLAARETE